MYHPRLQKQPFGRPEQDLAATLYQRTVTLPLAHQAACGKCCDVRRVSQLLICDFEFNTTRGFLADSAGKSHEYLGSSFPNSVAG
jgi:hypothetical protein